ncbi:hydrogenase maturation nickel metallochaperone HypA [Campylobacter geochelonis]|uniref:Hydrogenase maturation factor HypA n=1 Tax=Campylobacter geochelonis TaxID=1780362 RepID=A0A128EJT4_9BACT|nr:hydrogenase maturation nickel metallochaperone HypA [Campylobacter geochelonis]QKF71284.1 hydrogenase nickel insertion protein HypA [Campylobacter geochelonis]CZE49006.1 hydrogenase nickel insertion protein HypA [Campylobacter geochelonis]CZE51097.1 hydrogenase nickel insertion protein HypA [Campylobacter geochelonis]
MHELAIVQDLVALCEKNAKQNNAKEIELVEIKVGRLSGVEPHYLQSCYDVFKEGTMCANAELKIHLQEIVVKCEKCDFEGILEKNHFVCPKCGSSSLEVIDGEELYLMRLTMK